MASNALEEEPVTRWFKVEIKQAEYPERNEDEYLTDDELVERFPKFEDLFRDDRIQMITLVDDQTLRSIYVQRLR